MSKYITLTEPSDFERFYFLHEQPTFLDEVQIQTRVIPFIVYSIIALTILFNVIFYIIKSYAPTSWSPRIKCKVSYQMTNLLVNSVLGVMGLYHFLYTIPKNPSIDDQVIGWESLYPIAALQIAYQLWAIRMGLFVVKESPAMLVHHVAVIVASFMSSFLTIGFRYWTPFFFGMVEISSVPLSLMNTFKDHPVLIERYPLVYSRIRLTFALSFLVVRWAMFAPRQYIFLQQCMWAIQSSESYAYRIYMSVVWLSSFFLWGLQVFWGCLIIKGLATAFLSPKEKKELK